MGTRRTETSVALSHVDTSRGAPLTIAALFVLFVVRVLCFVFVFPPHQQRHSCKLEMELFFALGRGGAEGGGRCQHVFVVFFLTTV